MLSDYYLKRYEEEAAAVVAEQHDGHIHIHIHIHKFKTRANNTKIK